MQLFTTISEKPVTKTFASCLLVLALGLSALLAACAAPTGDDPQTNTKPPESSTTPASYDDVYSAIQTAFDERDSGYQNFGRTVKESGDLALSDVAPESSDRAATNSADSGSSKDMLTGSSDSYSETNTQVKGIDEGDIVKTDGRYIYQVSDSDIVILEAAGAQTKELSRITLDNSYCSFPDANVYGVNVQELYITGNTLAVLYTYTTEVEQEPQGDIAPLIFNYTEVSEIACFDVRKAEKPVYLTSLGQDGSYSSSRLQDGMLYLVSTKYVFDEETLDKDKPETYIPCYTEDAVARLIAPNDICILPYNYSTAYTTITSIDLDSTKRIDQQTLLGNCDTLYMSHNSIFIAENYTDQQKGEPYRKGVTSLQDVTEITSTVITKISISKGAIEVVADTTVPGSLLNQFSLDEYDDNLRLVTSVSTNRYSLRGQTIENDSYSFEEPTNALYVLDDKLALIGKIEGLAEEERVYSVRFDKEVGYFVTFRETDPLFTVDLSNPKNPKIMSELKIPGFSTYLHPYSEGRLFGLGMEADFRGVTYGMKMTMFDTTDPFDVSEKNTLVLDDYYSEALYEHRAIIVSEEHDIIGFPSEEGYVIYGYSDDKGFYVRQTLNQLYYGYYGSSLRGLYIDQYFYITSHENVTIYELESLKEVATVEI